MKFFKKFWNSVTRFFFGAKVIEIVVSPDGEAKRKLVKGIADRLVDMGYKLESPFLIKEGSSNTEMKLQSELINFLESPVRFYDGWKVDTSRQDVVIDEQNNRVFNYDLIFTRDADHVVVQFRIESGDLVVSIK